MRESGEGEHVRFESGKCQRDGLLWLWRVLWQTLQQLTRRTPRRQDATRRRGSRVQRHDAASRARARQVCASPARGRPVSPVTAGSRALTEVATGV